MFVTYVLDCYDPQLYTLGWFFFMTWINFTLLIKKKKKFQIDLIRRISGSTEFHFCGV